MLLDGRRQRWLRAAGHEPFLDRDLRDGISVGEDPVARNITESVPQGCGSCPVVRPE